jgi:hypothetical protein
LIPDVIYKKSLKRLLQIHSVIHTQEFALIDSWYFHICKRKKLFYFLNSYALPLANIIIDAAKCCPINNSMCQDRMYPEGTSPDVARQQVQNLPTGFSVSAPETTATHREIHRLREDKTLHNTYCPSFDVELRLFPCWVEGNIGSTDATKTCHNLNVYIFEINNRKVINNNH